MDSKAMSRLLNNVLRPLYRRVRLLVRRGVLTNSNSAPKMQVVQIQLTPDLVLEMEHFEPYGFTSNPQNGAEAIVGNIEGKSHPVSLIVADRRYRLKGMEKGEVALHDDQGQLIHLTRDAIKLVSASGASSIVISDAGIVITTPSFDLNEG